MEYSFNVEHAKKYGVNQAIMIKNIAFWIQKNKAQKKNEHNGRTWTYNSAEAFTLLFPFWNIRQIQGILKSLIENKVLITGNYNQIGFDRTLWYAFFDETLFIPEMEQKRSYHGFIYIIKNPDKNIYKIGLTQNLTTRMRALGVKNKTIVIATYETDDAYKDEKKLHRLFDGKNLFGEWFDLDNNDLICISKFKFTKIHLHKNVNGNTEILQPIPDNKPDNKPDEDRLKPYLPLSELLYMLHKKIDNKYLNNKYLPDIWAKWANDIRLLVEKDGRTIAEIEQVIRWVKTEGNFWFVNIMSGKKLRLQFPKLLLQMKQEGKKPGSFKGTDEELHSYDEFFGGNK